jgi:hypothetical protein
MELDQYLTLAVAVGSIATGIGAIWTAAVARRQLNEQRLFLQEQTVIARRQTQLTEESLGEQRQSLEEQNERGRINLEVDLMSKLREQWTSRLYQDYRRRSMQYVKENFLVNDELQETQYVDGATRELLDFFDEIGYLTRTGVLPIERVIDTHGESIWLGWALWEPAVKKLREEWADPSRYTNFEYLHHQGLDLDRNRGGTGAPPTKEQLRHWVDEGRQVTEELHSAVREKESASGGEKEPADVTPPK